MTPCLSHTFPHLQSKQHATSRLLPTIQLFLTHKDVSVCKLSHRRRCLYATCHIISYVLSQPSWFHTNASTTRRVHVRVRPVKDGYVHTFFDLRRHAYASFNTRHHVCHQISNRRSRNDVQPHDSTYEPFSVCNFSHTKPCLRTLVWQTRRIVMRVHCEKTSLYKTFWLTRHISDLALWYNPNPNPKLALTLSLTITLRLTLTLVPIAS